MKKNSIFSYPFWKTLLWKQNSHHKHGVFMHTMKVVYHTLKNKDLSLFATALLHDIGKPFVAYQKPEDIQKKEYSFTDHEEESYQIIKNWFFLSEYSKKMVRYHYLIRDISKSKKKGDIKRYEEKKLDWESLSKEEQEDLRRFLKYDDFGKV